MNCTTHAVNQINDLCLEKLFFLLILQFLFCKHYSIMARKLKEIIISVYFTQFAVELKMGKIPLFNYNNTDTDISHKSPVLNLNS